MSLKRKSKGKLQNSLKKKRNFKSNSCVPFKDSQSCKQLADFGGSEGQND